MPLPIMTAFQEKPPALDFIWPGFLAESVGAFVAPGAIGKSFFALEMAISVACATDEGDLIQFAPTRSGKVVYLAGEDPENVLRHRLYTLGTYLSPNARQSVADNLVVESIVGTRLNILQDAHRARIIALGRNTRLIILDTLSRIHHLNENDNSDMAQLLATLEYIAANTGAAILFLHHVNKTSATTGQADQPQAARGAGALVDNVRWAGFLADMTDREARRYACHPKHSPAGEAPRRRFVRFGVSKQNYAIASPDRWYQRHEGGVLLPANVHPVRISRLKPKLVKEGHGYRAAVY